MSLSFNGTTSSIVHTTADLGMSSSVSILCWIKLAGYGEGGVGIILGRDEGNNAFRFFSASTTSGMKFRNITGDTPGEWNHALALDTWYCVAVSFDRTNSPTPNPIFYVREVGVDSELISVSVTENQTPVGSSETPGTGYCNGSNAAASQTFNGLQARLQAWDAIVTEANLESASTDPGSYTTSLKLYIDDTEADVSGNGFTGTTTDVTPDAEDPIDFDGGGAIPLRNKLLLLGVGV